MLPRRMIIRSLDTRTGAYCFKLDMIFLCDKHDQQAAELINMARRQITNEVLFRAHG